MPVGYAHVDEPLTTEQLVTHVQPYAYKLDWMRRRGYKPHLYQLLFHTMRNPETGNLCRYRALCAGRRGGKTHAAAEDLVYYIEHPEQFWLDFYAKSSSDELHWWVVSKDLIVGRAALLTLRRAIIRAGLDGWQENRSLKLFEHANGSLIEFKTAVDPGSLRGMGLNGMWLDEAAFIPTRDAYDVATPALSDKEGIVMATTTPDGKNWFYDEFFDQPGKRDDPDYGTVEYRSLDNPHFPKKEWETRRKTYHPLMFKQEYEASFDAMSGKELPGEWLAKHFYTDEDLRDHRGQALQLTRYIGVDPAISLSDKADYFAMVCWGVTADGRCFMLDCYEDRLFFAEQLDVIREWHIRHRPMIIGVEAQAYQAALAQQAMRIDTMPPIAEIHAVGKKAHRILSMSALFRLGRARIRADQRAFVDRWLSYDSQMRNPIDDVLDAAEIGLRVAGLLLPDMGDRSGWDDLGDRAMDLETLAWSRRPEARAARQPYDPEMGSDW